MSIFLKNLPNIIDYQKVAIICGFCVAETCREYLPDENFQIKWPNDVLLNEKKLCGILVQTAVRGNSSRGAIGIGVNLNLPRKELPSELADKVVFLEEIKQNTIDIHSFEQALLMRIHGNFQDSIDKTFSRMISKINEILYKKDELVTLEIRGQSEFYRILRIEEDCSLSIKTTIGKELRVSIGEFL